MQKAWTKNKNVERRTQPARQAVVSPIVEKAESATLLSKDSEQDDDYIPMLKRKMPVRSSKTKNAK